MPNIRQTLALDLETAGLEPDAAVLEVGCVLYSVQHAAVVECYSALLHAEENPAVAVNGIAVGILRDAPPGGNAWDHVLGLAQRADVIVVHNVAFDKPRTPTALQSVKPWLDTMDVAFPKPTTSRSLVAICLAHGVPVTHAHRALTDALLIARLLERCAELGADVAGMLGRALLPRVKVIANVSYDDRLRARDAGFSWDASAKLWTKRMLPEEADALGFPYRIEASP